MMTNRNYEYRRGGSQACPENTGRFALPHGVFFLVLLVIVSTMVVLGNAGSASGAIFDHPSFNRDGSLVVLTRCESTCSPWIVNVRAGTVSRIESHDGDSVAFARFHPNNNSLLAVRIYKSADLSSFVQLNVSGNILREFQKNGMYKALPLFYQDGNRFAFVGAGARTTGDAKAIPRSFDFFETAVNSSVARRISHLYAYSLYPTLSDAEDRVFFSAAGLPKEVSATERGGFFARLTDKRFLSVTSFDALQPVMARNGSLAYIKRTDNLDGRRPGPYTYDVYVRGKGVEKRLTRLGAYVRRIAIAPAGDLIAAVVDKGNTKKLMVISVAGQIVCDVTLQ